MRRRVLRAPRSHSNRYVVIDIPHPRVDDAGFFAAIAHELQLPETSWLQLKSNVMNKLISLAEAGKRITLVIDEGQSIPETTLDTLLELSRQKQGKHMLLHTVIFAQTEFDDTLNTHRQKIPP